MISNLKKREKTQSNRQMIRLLLFHSNLFQFIEKIKIEFKFLDFVSNERGKQIYNQKDSSTTASFFRGLFQLLHFCHQNSLPLVIKHFIFRSLQIIKMTSTHTVVHSFWSFHRFTILEVWLIHFTNGFPFLLLQKKKFVCFNPMRWLCYLLLCIILDIVRTMNT